MVLAGFDQHNSQPVLPVYGDVMGQCVSGKSAVGWVHAADDLRPLGSGRGELALLLPGWAFLCADPAVLDLSARRGQGGADQQLGGRPSESFNVAVGDLYRARGSFRAG